MAELGFLKELGMTDGEIKTYHALFKLGKTTTGALIKEASIEAWLTVSSEAGLPKKVFDAAPMP